MFSDGIELALEWEDVLEVAKTMQKHQHGFVLLLTNLMVVLLVVLTNLMLDKPQLNSFDMQRVKKLAGNE